MSDANDRDEEREQLRAMIRGLFATHAPLDGIAAHIDSAERYDRAIWRRMGAELGLVGLAAPAVRGGSGGSLADLVVLLEETGYSLLCAPVLSSTVLAPTALLSAGDDAACDELLPGVFSGDEVLGLAVAERSGRWELETILTEAHGDGSRVEVTGSKTAVIDGAVADGFLVAARASSGIVLVHVGVDADGLQVDATAALDGTRSLADLRLESVPGRLVGTVETAWPAISHAYDAGRLGLAAEAVGGIRRLTELTIAHVREREQFGVPVGSFQAIKHRVADMCVALAAAERSLAVALWSFDGTSAQRELAAASVTATCADHYLEVAEAAIQLHGGIGFTHEYPAHRFLRRARSARALLGLPDDQRERVVGLAGLAPSTIGV